MQKYTSIYKLFSPYHKILLIGKRLYEWESQSFCCRRRYLFEDAKVNPEKK